MHMLASVKLKETIHFKIYRSSYNCWKDSKRKKSCQFAILFLCLLPKLSTGNKKKKWIFNVAGDEGILISNNAISLLRYKVSKTFFYSVASILLDVSNVYRNGNVVVQRRLERSKLKRREVHKKFLTSLPNYSTRH